MTYPEAKTTKTIATITLLSFFWVYLGLGEIAIAGKDSTEFGVHSSREKAKNGEWHTAKRRGEVSSPTLEDVLERMRKAEERAHKKIEKGEEIDEEEKEIENQEAGIEQRDAEIRKRFKDTEEKIKDLPEEIKQRHRDFVKKYEENYRTLKTQLNDIKKAKTGTEKHEAHRKAKEYLEKVKPPKKHIPLDPNKLPHRAEEHKELKKPRLKKEQFERDLSPQRTQGAQREEEIQETELRRQEKDSAQQIAFSGQHTAFGGTSLSASPTLKKGGMGGYYNDPVLVAANGSLDGLITAQNSIPGAGNLALLNSAPGAGNYLQLAALTPPTQDDLGETIEVQFTELIQVKAAELEHDPVKIYNWLRSTIEFTPTYGAVQGSEQCLITLQCNAFDTSALLISLLRVSNIPARYAYGTVELPIEQFMNWVGGFTDADSAMTHAASGGIPGGGVTSGGKVVAIQMEHIWVEAYIPYGNYRGIKRDDSIKTWIPMDASYKQYIYTGGFDMTATIPFNDDEYLSTRQEDNPVHNYQDKIQQYLDENMPDTSIIDVKGYREIRQETYHFLSPTLPYKTVAVLDTFPAMPSSMMHSVTFSVADAGSLGTSSYTAFAPEIAGKRITLSYAPALPADESLIESYGGYMFDVPAYLLNLKAELKIDGVVKLTGSATGLGKDQALSMRFTRPNSSTESAQKDLIAGTYYAIGIDFQGVNENALGRRNSRLLSSINAEGTETPDKDDLIGEHLYALAMTHFLSEEKLYRSGAKLFNVEYMRTLAEGIVSLPLSVDYLYSTPAVATPSGIEVDIALSKKVATSKEGNQAQRQAFMTISGLTGSYNEHNIFESIDGFESVSAVSAIQTANMNSIPIYTVDSSNISQILPTLQIDADVKTDIRNAVNAGKKVMVPETNIQIEDWNGTGYIITDPATGAGAYMISGGIGGGRNTNILADYERFKELYDTPRERFALDQDFITGNTVAYVAELSAIDESEIIRIANALKDAEYEGVAQCSGFVRIAYWGAGICLEISELPPLDCMGSSRASKYGINGSNGVLNHYSIAAMEGLDNTSRGVFTEEKAIAGDIVFFDNTYDKNNNCAYDDVLVHEGIVKKIDDEGTVTFIHASGTTVKEGKMNRQNNSLTPAYNSQLRSPCKKCSPSENCSPSSVCFNRPGRKPDPCTNETRANELFNSYGSIR